MVSSIDETMPFEVETDASDYADLWLFSRTLDPSEQTHSPVEKETYVIVESILMWRNYHLRREFKLITDQKSVSFMYNSSRLQAASEVLRER